MKKSIALWSTCLLTFIIACGKNSSDSGDEKKETVAIDKPADSTGATGAVKLDFSSSSEGATLNLENSTIDLGNGLIVKDARVCIAAIKLKADKDLSEEEKEFKEKLAEKDKELDKEIKADKDKFLKNIEKITTDFEANIKKTEQDQQDQLKSKLEKDLAEVFTKIATLEKAQDEKELAFEVEHDLNIRWKGPYVYSLITDKVTPELPEIKIEDGSYKRIEFKVKPNRTVASTDDLLNQSIVIEGTFNNTPYIITFPMSFNFRLSSDKAFEVAASGENVLNINFSLKNWFSNVDLSKAEIKDGKIFVDEGSNKTIFDALRKNIQKTTKFGKDEDKDGKLESQEEKGDGLSSFKDIEVEEKEDLDDSKDDESGDEEEKKD